MLHTFPCRVLRLRGLRINFIVVYNDQDVIYAQPGQSALSMARKLTIEVRRLFATEGRLLAHAQGLKEIEIVYGRAGMLLSMFSARSFLETFQKCCGEYGG